MKKITFLILTVISFTAKAQFQDAAPTINLQSNSNYLEVRNPDVTSFLYDIGTSIGTNGNAGVVFINNQFWVSAWASANIHILNTTGGFVETFTVSGVTGIRSFTTDGTNVYAGTNTTSISIINPVTRTLSGTISTTLPFNIRFLTYDSTLNSGAGGFWVGNFSTDIVAINLSGGILLTIPAATHGLSGMYGVAVNPTTQILYVYCQMPPNNDTISSLSLPSGTSTGLVYDVFTNDLSSGGTTSSLAGGTFLSTEVVSGQTTLIGISQATPSNMLWGINIDNLLSQDDLTTNPFGLYPNPMENTLHFTKTDFDSIRVYSLDGKEVSNYSSTELRNQQMDVSGLSSGLYIVAVQKGNIVENLRMIKQ